MQRKLGGRAVLAIVGGAVAIGVAVNVFAAHRQSSDRAASTPAPCRPAHPAYGTPPQGLTYARATPQVRRRTLRALHIGERADMQLVQRDGVVYGEVVGVTTRDPQAYVEHVVAQANGHAQAAAGYSLIPYGDNDVAAVGARGCRAVYVAAATPDDVKVLAPAVITG
jgi:hypothetical protein